MKDVNALMADLGGGMETLQDSNPEAWAALNDFMGKAFAPGKLDAKTKELIAIGVCVFSRCEYCIAAHAANALKAGCTKEEILEAATVATAFGGGPTMAYSSAVLVAALEEFGK